MKILWIIIKIAVVVLFSLYLADIDGFVIITWAGYYIDMSATVFAILGIATGFSIWKFAKGSAFLGNAPSKYLNNRKVKHQSLALGALLDAQTAFYNKDREPFERNFNIIKKSMGSNHPMVILLQIECFLLDGKYLQAIALYKKNISCSTAHKAGQVLYNSLNDRAIEQLLEIQIEYEDLVEHNVLQDWAYAILANRQTNYDSAVAQIDVGVKLKAIDTDFAIVKLALLDTKFNGKKGLDSLIKAWLKTEHKDLLPAFKSIAPDLNIKDYKTVEKALGKATFSNNEMSKNSHLIFSYLACGVSLWGVAKDHLEHAKTPPNIYYSILATIEKSEYGKTDLYMEYLQKASD